MPLREGGAGREAEEELGTRGWRRSGGSPPGLVGEEEEDAEVGGADLQAEASIGGRTERRSEAVE
jgi:hypothetical protein